jgi:hypothetical protein
VVEGAVQARIGALDALGDPGDAVVPGGQDAAELLGLPGLGRDLFGGQLRRRGLNGFAVVAGGAVELAALAALDALLHRRGPRRGARAQARGGGGARRPVGLASGARRGARRGGSGVGGQGTQSLAHPAPEGAAGFAQ